MQHRMENIRHILASVCFKKHMKWEKSEIKKKIINQQLIEKKVLLCMLYRMEIWTILPGCLSTGKHISRTEVKKNGNIWLDLRLVLIMILPKEYFNSHSQKYLPLFFHVQFYKSKENGYCKKFWKYMNEFSSEHSRNWTCHRPFNLALLAPTQHFHWVVPPWNCSHTQMFAVAFLCMAYLQYGRLSFPWQCNMQIHSTDAKLSPLSAAYHTEIASSVQTPSIVLPRL